jgi:hypothetical protein
MTKNDLIKQIVKMIERDWTGKKGYWTDSEMFKYTSFYTGNKNKQNKKAS